MLLQQIRKSIDEVKQFSLELTSASQLLPLVNVKIPQFTHQDNSLDTTLIGQEVESFVNDLLKIDNEDFWKLGSIHKFLEYVESDTVSNMTELRLHVLTDQVSFGLVVLCLFYST